MSSPALKLVLPRWTKRVVTDMGGRDPLGLSRVAFLITDYLLPGIITTTDRARYYSFYCWALWHIQKEEQPKKYQDFVNAFRRREATMALATLIANQSTSPVGVEATRKYFERGTETGSFDCDFKVLPSNALGGYGQYYGGSIYKLRLSHTPEDGIDHVTEGIAEELARSFQSALEGTPYLKKHLFTEKEISGTDLRKSSGFLTLDALGETFAADERQKLTEIFFGLGHPNIDEETVLRRQTLTHLLHIISEYERAGCELTAERRFGLDEYLLYPMYYGCLWPEKNQIISYKAPKELSFCTGLWRQFCLHQFLSQALEDLLCSVLEAAGAQVLGLTVEEIAADLTQNDFFSYLSSATGKKYHTPKTLLSALGMSDVPDESFSIQSQRELSPKHKLSEARILYMEVDSPQSQAARAVLLLAVVYGKWVGIANDIGYRHIAQRAGTQLWAGNLLYTLDDWLSSTLTWEQALQSMIEQFVINKHDQTVYEKRRLYSSWLSRTEGKVFKEQDYEPVWRASRFLNCVKIMADLGLLRIDTNKALTMTGRGRKFLEKLTHQ